MLIETVARHSRREPTRLAVVAADDRLTYAELQARSSGYAAMLRRHGIGPGSLVALHLPRTADAIASMLGVLGCGAAYTFVEDDGDRAGQVRGLLGTGSDLIVTVPENLERLRAAGLRAVVAAADPVDDGPVAVTERDPAYVLYTSGSTGVPKGVVVSHGNIRHYVRALTERLDIRERLAYAHVSTLSADLGNTCLFLALCTGGVLHVVDDLTRRDPGALLGYIRDERIDFLKITPSHWNAVFHAVGADRLADPILDYLVLGGEMLSRKLAEATLRSGVTRRLVNHYGPTETTIGVAARSFGDAEEIASLQTASVPIGAALGDTTLMVETSAGHYETRSATGELFIGGPGVASGYRRDEAATRAAFVDMPDGSRVYRSGDLVRIDADGVVEFLGRVDRQVKISGHRVELEHVEIVARQLTGVIDAAAFHVANDTGGALALALVTDSTVSVRDVRGQLAEALPRPMVPSRYVPMPGGFPRNANGKTDLRALRPLVEAELAAAAPTDERGADALEPDDQLAREVCRAWRRRLGHANFGFDSDFFEVGGTSLDAILVIADLQAAGHRMSARSFLAAPTVLGLANRMAGEDVEDDRALRHRASLTGDVIRWRRHEPATGDGVRAYEHVLLTGATGFVGAHLLHAMLATTTMRIACLVRDPAGAAAARLAAAYRWYFPGHDLDDFAGRVTVCHGDVGEPLFGLPEAQYHRLCDQADAVYHVAADTRLFGKADAFRGSNVESVRTAIDMARRGRRKDLHHVSTLAVAGINTGGHIVDFAEDDLDIGQEFQNSYEWSKFNAEKLVREYQAEGGGAFVYRLGNVAGDSRSGRFQRNGGDNRIVQLLAALVHVGRLPRRLDRVVVFSPVDEVARGILTLSLCARVAPGTFHVDSGLAVTYREIFDEIARLGFAMEPSDAADLADVLDDRDATAALGHFWARRPSRNVRYDNSMTARLLESLGGVVDGRDRDWLSRYVSHLAEEGHLGPVAVGAGR